MNVARHEFNVFDPAREWTVVERKLPHWSQAGTITFITFRTCDSMPAAVVAKWKEERRAWLDAHGAATRDGLCDAEKAAFDKRFISRWEGELDRCHGDLPLRRSDAAKIVAETLQSGADRDYVLTDFVVMPNHVHLLVAFPHAETLIPQCERWKRFSAVRINRLLGRRGRFWQKDAFDHAVRSDEQFRALRRYIADNPRKAGLRAGEYLHYSESQFERCDAGGNIISE